MAVTSWTSEGMDWSDLHGKTLYPYIEALRLALVERLVAVGMGVPVDLASPIPAGVIPTVKWATLYDTTLRSVYWFYVDKDNSPTVWTLPALIAAVGDSSWIWATRHYPFTKSWAMQKYNMLNKLVWPYTEAGRTTSQIRAADLGTSWADAVTYWNTVAYWGMPYSFPADWPGGLTFIKSADRFQIVRFRSTSILPTGWTGVPGDVWITCDYDDGGESRIYTNPDCVGALVRTPFRLFTGSLYGIPIGDFPSVPPEPPIVSNNVYTYFVRTVTLIRHQDNVSDPNCFQFRLS